MERLGEVGLPSPNTGNQLDRALLQRRRRCLEASTPGWGWGGCSSELLEPVN